MDCIHREILDNINKKYVLLESGYNNYSIINKLTKTYVVISDPIINYSKLIETMIDKKVKIYRDFTDLPDSKLKKVDFHGKNPFLNLIIKNLYDERRRKAGCIIVALQDSIPSAETKKTVELRIIEYASVYLFPYQGVNVFSEVNDDLISVIIIRNINELPSEKVEISF